MIIKQRESISIRDFIQNLHTAIPEFSKTIVTTELIELAQINDDKIIYLYENISDITTDKQTFEKYGIDSTYILKRPHNNCKLNHITVNGETLHIYAYVCSKELLIELLQMRYDDQYPDGDKNFYTRYIQFLRQASKWVIHPKINLINNVFMYDKIPAKINPPSLICKIPVKINPPSSICKNINKTLYEDIFIYDKIPVKTNSPSWICENTNETLYEDKDNLIEPKCGLRHRHPFKLSD